MEFRYYYLLQDLVGILLIFLYSRMIFLSIKLFLAKGINIRRIRLLLSQIIFFSIGVYLCLIGWSLKAILFSLGLFLLGTIIKPKSKKDVL